MKMKKILLIVLVLVINSSFILAQKKGPEYTYLGVKISAVNNISFAAAKNNYVFLKTPRGNLMKQSNMPLTYSYGGAFSIIYNDDNKNDRRGIVFGLDFQYHGFQNTYKSDTLNFSLTNQYRVMSIGVPVYFKFWFSNIYKNQLYATLGAEFNYFLNVYNYQTSSWSGDFTAKMPKAQLNKSSLSLLLGFNYNIFFINFQLLANNYINKNFTTTIEEGTIYPYENLNIFNNLTIQTGINIPLTRWLTARNWTAEKIRRMLKRSK